MYASINVRTGSPLWNHECCEAINRSPIHILLLYSDFFLIRKRIHCVILQSLFLHFPSGRRSMRSMSSGWRCPPLRSPPPTTPSAWSSAGSWREGYRASTAVSTAMRRAGRSPLPPPSSSPRMRERNAGHPLLLQFVKLPNQLITFLPYLPVLTWLFSIYTYA
jgi:hypothetical protein